MATAPVEGLGKLREPFPPHQVSKLPKETRPQIDARKTNKDLMVWKCPICGGAHHKNATHLDYVGHAALTDRLLDTDPAWSWEPAAYTPEGLPAFDKTGGLWIKLTVLGVTRLGYGAADGKQGGDAVKEIIGDALRNAAMRFGAALDLWHKGDLHADDDEDGATKAPANDAESGLRETLRESVKTTPKRDLPFPQGPAKNRTQLKDMGRAFWRDVEAAGDPDELDILLDANRELMAQIRADLPTWMTGGEKDGEKFEGLDDVIERKRTEFANDAWKHNPLSAG